MVETENYRLEVVYSAALGREFGGCFSLRLQSMRATLFFASRDERELLPGTNMQEDSYPFERQATADESFDYACDQLRDWADSHNGEPFLVRLKNADGQILRRVKGNIGGRQPSSR
jgi:hypothetical protein